MTTINFKAVDRAIRTKVVKVHWITATDYDRLRKAGFMIIIVKESRRF